jgi:membrane-associated PAP2 superfamily phosphatase
MNRTGLFVALGIAVAAGLAFGLYPELDLRVSRYFYGFVVNGNTFGWRLDPRLMTTRDAVLWLPVALIVPPLVALAIKLIWPRRKLLISARAILFLTATLALGPGLVVNVGLKDHWGRSRPIDVIQFGGPEHFVAWWDPRGDCPNNCSFVSGDVSGAFWTLAPAVLAPPAFRAVAVGAALALGTGMAVMRLMAGGHFTSDVIFAGVLTFLIIWVVHGLIYRWPRTRLTDEGSEKAIEHFIARWRRANRWLFYRVAGEIACPDTGDAADEKPKRPRRGWW